MPPRRRKPIRRKTSSRKPLWTPAAGLSQSALSKWLACPEQFSLSYIEGITSRSLSVPIEFGNLFHLCLEFQGKDTPESVAAKCCSAYLLSRGKNVIQSEYDEFQRLVGLVKVVFPLYVKRWEVKDKLIRWIAREQKFKVSYPLSAGTGPSSRIILVGKRDGVFRDSKKRLCLFETKTKSDINTAAITDQLRADFQTMFYLVTLMMETGETPAEVLYNVVRRPGLRYRKGDSLQKYLDRVKADIEFRPSYYFSRWRVQIDASSLTAFRQITLDPALRNFLHWWRSVEQNPFDRFKSPFHLLNLPALLGLPGGRHGRSELYEAVIRHSPNSYYIRKEVFPELLESIQIEEAA